MPPFSKTWAFPRIYLSANYFGTSITTNVRTGMWRFAP
jgi:hypothetical protein